MKKHVAAFAAIAAAVSLLPGISHASDNPAGCAADVAGGEWRSYGGSLNNNRNQTESTIDAAWVGAMEPDWVFSPAAAGLTGGFSNTPIVADGCVYLGSNTGWIVSLNADTGTVNWAQKVSGSTQSALAGGAIIGSPVAYEGVLYVGVNKSPSPYLAAFDQASGTPLWQTLIEEGKGWAQLAASPVASDGMVFMGLTAGETDPAARGGYSIIEAGHDCGGDAFDGAVQITFCPNPVASATGGTRLVKEYTINDVDYAAGYRGASVWCTAAIDPETKTVYACGGNPASKKIEHRNSNSLLKIDFDRTSPTFGQIVDSYHGDTDQYYPGTDRQPACDAFGDIAVAWSVTCLQLDLDFGASPMLWKNAQGHTMVGDIQKSGVFHTLFTEGMTRAWTTIVGTPGIPFNAASPAYAVVGGEARVFMGATTPTVEHSLSAEGGRYRWATPIGSPTHFNATSTANGLVYTVAGDGALHVMNASDGVPVAIRPLMQDTGASTAESGSSGVALARNQIFAAQGQFVVAYASGS